MCVTRCATIAASDRDLVLDLAWTWMAAIVRTTSLLSLHFNASP
jgi:hypothetical protein